MVAGQALVNAPRFGLPDFTGQADMVGQTFTNDGPTSVVVVLKCPNCGHSALTAEPFPNAGGAQ
jgi:hypothetical protein